MKYFENCIDMIIHRTAANVLSDSQVIVPHHLSAPLGTKVCCSHSKYSLLFMTVFLPLIFNFLFN